ncbi:MAG: PKD domain-containing protein [Crocinitomicaceae bacterium]|nr:PKD domain-containing protein [Crocinitomicaceae bacterium]
MRLLRFIVLFALFMKMSASTVNAQIDTLFWFACPWVTPDHNGNTPLAFRVSTFNNAATVRMQLPSATFDTTFVVPANSLGNVDLTYLVNDLESAPANAVLTTGMKITSDEMITVVYDFISLSPNNPETYSLKGQNGMGLEFVVPFQTLWDNKFLGGASPLQPKQFFSVVATEDNTTIYIKPNCDVEGHPADITYSVLLPVAGNVYTCQNSVQTTSVPGSSLSGSIVTSDKPVSVVINDDSVNPSGGGGCYDLMGDQIVPTDVIGNEYIVNIGGLNPGSNESIFIIPAENFTTITVTDGGTSTQLMNQGETWQYSITDLLTHVISDKPVYLIHMSGYGCELGIAILPPLNCAGSDEVSFARNNNQAFSINLLCEAGDQAGFALTAGGGGTGVINPASFNVVPGTGGAWVGTQIDYTNAQVVSGFQNTITNSLGYFSMGVINGGATSGCLYHYMSSFHRKVITDAGTDITVCSGEPVVNLNGSVIGGTTTGEWEVLNGTGTLNNPTTLITTYDPSPGDYTQGFVTFVLSSTGNCEPVRDTMRIDYIQSPITSAGVDDSYCKNNIGAVPISGSVQFASGASWSGGNGGAFGNPGSLSTTYTLSPADLALDSVVLYLTSAGSLFACPDDQDTMVIYLTPAPVVIPGPSLVLCSSETIINLNGSVSGATTDGVWSSSGFGGFSPSAANPVTDYNISANDILAGTIYLTLLSTGNGSCLPEEDSIQVTFLNEPIVNITANDSVCSNLSLLDLNGTVSFGFTSTWTTDGFGSVVAPGSLTTQYNITSVDTAQGYVNVYLASSPGICPSVLDSMTIYFIDPPDANAGIDQNYCDNQVVQLNGSVTGVSNIGSWTTTMGTGSFSPSPNLLITNYVPSPEDLTNGSVTLILTSTSVFGCPPDVSTMTVTFLETPTADFTATVACEGDNTVFTDQSTTGSGTISNWGWDFGDAGTSIVQDPTHTYSGSGSYNATLIAFGNNGCSDTVMVPVTINPVPIADFSPTIACQDTPVDFVDLSFLSSGTITDWLYDFGAATSTDQNPSYTFTNTGAQLVTLTVTSDLGCVDDTVMTLTITPSPIADFSYTPNPALVNETVTFTDLSTGNNINQWYWDFGDNEADNVQNPIHNYSQGGDYIIVLEVTDGIGCTDTTSKVITIALPPVLPTGFTPTGDGENDVFWIRGGPFEAVAFNIYNNWGELIFSSNETDYISSWEDLGWDGMYNGEPAPMGVYTWTFVVRMANDQIVKDSGDVTLIR